MDPKNAWDKFFHSGKIVDYLAYCQQKPEGSMMINEVTTQHADQNRRAYHQSKENQ